MRIDVGTIPSSLPPRKVPRTDPPRHHQNEGPVAPEHREALVAALAREPYDHRGQADRQRQAA